MNTPAAITWEQIEDEINSLGAWERRLGDFEAHIPRALAALTPSSVAPPGAMRGAGPAGCGLLNRLAPANRDRYETILYFERRWGDRTDYEWLIGPACWVLESELARLLAAPARAVVPDLLAALDHAGDAGPARLLEKWVKTGITTMGVECLLLLALRRGCEQGLPSVLGLLAEQFEPSYTGLLQDKRLGHCLDVVCGRFRNKACHGESAFGAGLYEEFAHLVVANRRFLDWHSDGPAPNPPPPDAGILHHHLALARCAGATEAGAAAPESPAVARLLALQTPPQSPLRVGLRAVPAAAAPGLRDVEASAAAPADTFRLGDRVRLEFTASADGHVTLIDVGTSGAVAVVRPNAWRRDTAIAGGSLGSLPSATSPEFEYRLSGRLGVERVKALLTRQPLPPEWLLPEGGQGTRPLTSAEVERLVAAVEQLPPTDWAAAVCAFRVEA
jgi:hypothetical protein